MAGHIHSARGKTGIGKKLIRRVFWGAVIAVQSGFLPSAGAENYPVRPIRLIVPQAAGGQNDVQSRVIAQQLTSALGQQVIVDNRPGAGGAIGFEIASKASADGYTLVAGSISTLAVIPALPVKPRYDVFRDFQPVTQISSSPYILVVNPAVPAKTVSDLVSLAKARPDALSYGSSGNATGIHLTTELFKIKAGIRMVHVPYKGAAPATTDLLANQIQVMFNNVIPALPHLKSGRLRALAVSSESRSAVLPDVPTVAESGYAGFSSGSWQGLVTVARTPAPIVRRLHAETVKVLGSEESRRNIAAHGNVIVTSSPEEFAGFIRAQYAVWVEVIKVTGIGRE